MVDINTLTKPFVGLRPFESSESELFFGREEQTIRLLTKLHQTNFVAVVGSSGSGKSSLVKAGLIPALKAGFLNKGDYWHIVSFRPGDNPMYYFAKALIETVGLKISAMQLEASIKLEGTDEILKLVSRHLSSEGSMLILIDQFEELFTHFKHTSDQAALMYRFEFVKIILELIQSKLPIYVILTMRSDFIGKCNVFYGLPEALSNSQFLVPRLQSSELFNVIECPVKLFGCRIEPGLTQKILNDLKDDEDQLPVLEHTLNQLWNKKSHPHLITFEDYKAIGKLENALSNHANEIYNSIGNKHPGLRVTIKEMFKYIIDFDGEKREGVRQPRKVKDIQNVTGASFQEIKTIYDAFSAEHACFLFSPSGMQLHADSVIDISHESLMREWNLFKTWKEDEEKDKRILERLADSARDYNEKKREALRGPELQFYSTWERYMDSTNVSKRERTLNWANRYSINFQAIIDFIKVSKRLTLIRKVARWSLVILVLLGSLGFLLVIQQHQLDEAKSSVRIAELNAENSKMKSIEDSLKLERSNALNQALASESSAQAALFNAGNEIERLKKETASLRNSIAEKDKFISKGGSDSRVQELMAQNSRLTNDVQRQKEIAEVERKRALEFQDLATKAEEVSNQRLQRIAESIKLRKEVLARNSAVLLEELEKANVETKLEFKASAKKYSYKSVGGLATYRFQIFPDAKSGQGDLERIALITYIMDNPTFLNPLIATGPDTKFTGTYDGVGCLTSVIAVIEYLDIDKPLAIKRFNMCEKLEYVK